MKVQGFKDTIAWYNKNADRYSKSVQNLPSAGIDEFVNKLPEGAKVLDAGCASGRDSQRLFDKGIEVVGIDLSSSQIDLAKKTYPGISFIEGDFLSLPFGDGSFEGVWAHASLLHFENVVDVQKALKEFSRVLKKGGILHVFVKEKTTENKFEIVTDSLSNHDRFFQYFSKDEIEGYIIESGFDVVKTERQIDAAGRKEVSWLLFLGQKR